MSSQSMGGSGNGGVCSDALQEYQDARREYVKSSERFRKAADVLPHIAKSRDLFNKWGPFYEGYMRFTNHEGAARALIRQLNAIGDLKKDRVFRGRGIDVGGGTGLITREIGYRATRKALIRLKNNPMEPAFLNFVDRCLRQQNRIINLVEDPFSAEKEDVHIGLFVLDKLRKLVEKDRENRCVAGFKHYQYFWDLINRKNILFSELQKDKNMVIVEKGPAGEDVVFKLRPLLLGYISDILSTTAKETAADFHARGTPVGDFLKQSLSGVVDMTVLDLSPVMLEVAREKVRPVYLGLASDMFVEEDATRLSAVASERGWSGSFDFAVIAQLLHLMPDEDRRAMLNGVLDVLKPDGKLVVIDEWAPLYSGKTTLTSDPDVLMMLGEIQTTFMDIFKPKGRAEMRKLIEDSGFMYSNMRASCPIDEHHTMYGHLYFRKDAI